MSYESESIEALKIDMLTIGKKIMSIETRLKAGEILVTHQSDRYRLVIERAASTKGVDGFKAEVNGDDFDVVQNQIAALYDYTKNLTGGNKNVGTEIV